MSDFARKKTFFAYPDFSFSLMNNVFKTFEEGLEGRVSALQWESPSFSSWALSESSAPLLLASRKDGATLGYNLIYEVATKKIEMGPPANHADLSQLFREFWGEKAELRRFRDGSIVECVYWERPGHQLTHIVKDIAHYLLHFHFGVNSTRLNYLLDQLDDLIVSSKSNPLSPVPQLQGTFQDLSEKLKNLKRIPLHILNLHPLSQAFSGTSLFTPHPHPFLLQLPHKRHSSACVPSFLVGVEMEPSSQWPRDFEAVEKVKQAFYLHISSELEKQHGIKSVVSDKSLLLQHSGYVFRLFILHKNQVSLAKEEGRVLESNSLKRLIEFTPVHISALRDLGFRFPAFPDTVRLAKRFYHAHLFSHKLDDTLIELLTAFVFLRFSLEGRTSPFASAISSGQQSYSPPSSPLIGFLRFLELVSEFDFESHPLVLDFNGSIVIESTNFLKQFENSSIKSDGLPFIVTNYQFSPLQHNLTPLIFQRMRTFAKKALKVVKKNVEEKLLSGSLRASALDCVFVTSLEEYDAVIHLKPEMLPNYEHSVQVRKGLSNNVANFFEVDNFKNIRPMNDNNVFSTLLVDFSPAEEYLKLVESLLGRYALFFFDKHGGSNVGVVWKKEAFKPFPFRVDQSFCTVPFDVNFFIVIHLFYLSLILEK